MLAFIPGPEVLDITTGDMLFVSFCAITSLIIAGIYVYKKLHLVSPARVDPIGRRRNPRLARAISIVPGLGQLYYGAPKRALQYAAGVVVPGALAAAIYEWSLFDLATAPI